MLMFVWQSISYAYNVLLKIIKNAGGYMGWDMYDHGEVHDFMKVVFLHFQSILSKRPPMSIMFFHQQRGYVLMNL